MAKESGKKRKSPKVVLLGGLVALAALAGAYLSDCIPGLPFGASKGGDQEAKANDEEPAPEQEPTDPSAPVAVVVDGETCSRSGDDGRDCDALCKSLTELDPPRDVSIDGTKGTHKAVMGFVDCLKEADLKVSLSAD